MKQKSKKLILLLIISLAMILGFATMVNAADVMSISVANYRSRIGLVIGEHESEQLSVEVKDTSYQVVSNPNIEWKSSDTSIVTVDSKGVITAVKAGTAKVTASVSNKSAEFEITVEQPKFTDFSNAEYELEKSSPASLKLNVKNIKNVVNKYDSNRQIYYCVTEKNEKPSIKINQDGRIDLENKNWIRDGAITSNNWSELGFEEYAQYNQDMYLWVYEGVRLEQGYRNEEIDIMWINKLIVSGQKLERPKNPVYAEFFSSTFMTHEHDQLVFNMPYVKGTERKFTLKIGKITDKNILNGIKNNKGEKWNSLLEYAKKSNAVFNKELTTNTNDIFAEYSNALGEQNREIIKPDNLEDKAYYYMYVVFDDENGKYYPASGLTIAKADVFTSGEHKGDWYMFFLGDEKFKWDDFGTTQTGTATVDRNTAGTTTKAKTTKPKSLPKTGSVAIGLVIVAMIGIAVFFKVKNNKYRGI